MVATTAASAAVAARTVSMEKTAAATTAAATTVAATTAAVAIVVVALVMTAVAAMTNVVKRAAAVAATVVVVANSNSDSDSKPPPPPPLLLVVATAPTETATASPLLPLPPSCRGTKIALVEKSNAGEDTDKYFDLVSIARGPGRGEHPSPLAEKYRAEIEKLKCIRDGEWHHGFNTGMLAASRMYTCLAMSTEEEAYIQFSDDSVEEGDFIGLRRARRISGAQFVKPPVQMWICFVIFHRPKTDCIDLFSNMCHTKYTIH